LIVAGLLFFVAIITYWINDAEERARLKQGRGREQEAHRLQIEQVMKSRQMLQAETERSRKEWLELQHQNDAIIKSLRRIERMLESMALNNADR
jgi:hypothetical protein